MGFFVWVFFVCFCVCVWPRYLLNRSFVFVLCSTNIGTAKLSHFVLFFV